MILRKLIRIIKKKKIKKNKINIIIKKKYIKKKQLKLQLNKMIMLIIINLMLI